MRKTQSRREMAIAPSQSTASTITTLSAAQSREMAAAGKMNLIAIDAMDPDLSPDQAGSENESQGPASDPPDEQLSADDSTGPASVKAEQGEDDSADVNQTTSAPAQKRRRVTRACDECRRKKIKCDGKQPCTHCSVYSYGWSPQRIFVSLVGAFSFFCTPLFVFFWAPYWRTDQA